MEQIKKSDYEILHFDSKLVNKTVTKIDSNIQVNFLESYAYFASIPKGPHTVDVYKVEATVYHNLPASKTILNYWSRPSASNLFPKYESNGDLMPHHRVRVTSIDQNSAALEGYIYNIIGNAVIPIQETSSEITHAYSLLVENSPVGTDNKIGDLKINIFPNPTEKSHKLSIYLDEISNITVELFDLQGRMIRSVFSSKKVIEELIIESDVSLIASGLYIYRVHINGAPYHIKFIKK